MKKFMKFALLCAVAVLATACPPQPEPGPDGPDGPQSGEFTINNPSPISMTTNAQTTISLNGARVSEVTFESSDVNVVTVDNKGTLTSFDKEGDAVITVTRKKDNLQKTVNVEVRSFLNKLHFNTIVVLGSSAPDYMMYRIRANYGGFRPDGFANPGIKDDYSAEYAEDPASVVGQVFPEQGHWTYLYSTTNSQGTEIEWGIFHDSIAPAFFCLLSDEVIFINGVGFNVTEAEGAMLQCPFKCWKDPVADYVFWGGEYYFIDDLTAIDSIRPEGVEAVAGPEYLQGGHFNAENYLEVFTQALNAEEGDEIDWSAYPYFNTDDAVLYWMLPRDDEDNPYAMWDMGYPLNSASDTKCIYLGNKPQGGMTAQSYDIDFKILDNYMYYGLDVEFNEQGEGRFTGEMGPISDRTYTGSNQAAELPKRNNDGLREKINCSVTTVSNVNKTVGATIFALTQKH